MASTQSSLIFQNQHLSLGEDLRSLVSRRPVLPALALQSRPQNLISSSLRGDIGTLEQHPEWFNFDENQRIVRFFVSSTFDDTKHERDVLIKHVMPALQSYARGAGFEAVLSEMRFGIRKSLGEDHKTTEVCMAELQRCIETSAGLCYVLLSCDRYGFRAPPRRIPACDIDGIMAIATADERDILLEYYALDENELRTPQECYNISVNFHGASNVAGPAYVLNSVSSVRGFWDRFPLLQLALRSAADRYWPNASSTHLRDPQSQHPVKFFFFSITEEEISRGIFWRDSAHVAVSAHVFQRSLTALGGTDLRHMPVGAPELKNYIDLSSDKTTADFDAARLLREQQDMIARSLSQHPACLTTFPPIEWRDGKGIDPSDPQHAAYLQHFAETALTRLLDSTDAARERLAVEPHAGMAEAIFHLKFAMQRASKFFHSSETQHVTAKLRDYLASADGPGHAFVIHGASGSGKTYLMAEAADREAHALSSPADAVIVRFLGTSPASSNLTDFLSSLCRQLHAVQDHNCFPYTFRVPNHRCDVCRQDIPLGCQGLRCEQCDHNVCNNCKEKGREDDEIKSTFRCGAGALPSSDDVEKLKEYFDRALKTWQTGRLTVFLDSLDQLDDTGGGRKLGWLSTHGISPNVRLVISTLPDEAAPADGKPFACLSILQKRYSRSPSDSAMAEVQPVDDVRSLLLHLLKLRQHTLSDAQLRVLEAAIKLSPKTQTPLVVTILAVRFSEWPSHRDLPPDNKNPDGSLFVDTTSVRALVVQEFKALEAKHGPELVRAVLSFITLAKDGVSETELSEVLSLDDDVLASVYEWWVPPVRTLPTNPLTMLLADLKPYLTMRGAASGGGGLMMRWYHRQFWEAADFYFLHDAEERRRRHAQLGEFFSGAWADRSKPYNDRLKAAVQKKVAGEVSGDRRVRPQPLCLREGKSIFATKGDAGAVNERRCREAAHHWIAAGMLCKAADELCSFEGICARARIGEGFELQQQLINLGSRIRSQLGARDPQAALALHHLLRVEHYAHWLQRDMSIICENPEEETITTCSRQPQLSLAREDLRIYLQQTSAGVSFCIGSLYRSFVLGPIRESFDTCIFELHHEKTVRSIAYNSDSSLLASATNDNTVKIWNTKLGMMEYILKGHTGSVSAVAWSRDNRRIVTGSHDATARLWDAHTYQEISVFRGHTTLVHDVAIDGSGAYVASIAGGVVLLWDASTQQEFAVLGKGNSSAIAFDVSGKQIALGSGKDVYLLDAHTHQELAVFYGHTKTVRVISFDVTGRRIASGSMDETARIWDVHTHQELAVLRGHLKAVTAVVFDESGKYIASGGWDDHTVRLWDALTYQQLNLFEGHTTMIHQVVFHASGKCIASAADKTIRVWNLQMQQTPIVIKGHLASVHAVAFDRTGRYIASGSDDETVRLWDARTHQELAVLQGHTHKVNAVAFDATGTHVASGSYDQTVRLWNLHTHQEVAVIKSHKKSVSTVAFDESGRYIASSSDKTILIWDIAAQKEAAELSGHTRGVNSVVFDASGRFIVSGAWDNTVRLWNALSNQEICGLRLERVVDAVAIGGFHVAFIPASHIIHVWNIQTGEITYLKGHTSPVNSIAFDKTAKYLVSGSNDTTVRLWDVVSQQELAILKGHTSSVRAVAFDPNGKYIVSGSLDDSVRLWDATLHDSIASHAHQTDVVTSTSFSPSSAMVACASASINNNNICIWSTLSHTALVSLQVLSSPCCMVWSRDETLLIIGAGDGSISVWEVASGLQHAALVCPEAAPISEIKVSSDARFLAAVVNTSTACVHVFNLHPEQLLASLVFKGSTLQLQWSADGRTLRDAQGDVWNCITTPRLGMYNTNKVVSTSCCCSM